MFNTSRTSHLMKRSLFLLVFMFFNTGALAADTQDHNSIYKAASVFLHNKIGTVDDQQVRIETGKLDSRLRLSKCSTPLEAYLPAGSRTLGNITVGVKCTDHKPWSLYVPMSVSQYKHVLVASQLLARGTILSKDDVKSVRFDLARLPHGYVTEPADSIGMVLKRQLSAGAPLTPNLIEKPQIISRGQEVSILAESGSMEIRMLGKALSHGAEGDRISVINKTTRRKLEGIVAADGTVRIEI